MSEDSATARGKPLLELLSPLIGLAVLLIGSLAASQIAPKQGPGATSEPFELIAAFSAVMLIIFVGIFLIASFLWGCWKITEAIA